MVKLHCMEHALFKHNLAYSFARFVFLLHPLCVCVCVEGGRDLHAPRIIFYDSLCAKIGLHNVTN